MYCPLVLLIFYLDYLYGFPPERFMYSLRLENRAFFQVGIMCKQTLHTSPQSDLLSAGPNVGYHHLGEWTGEGYLYFDNEGIFGFPSS